MAVLGGILLTVGIILSFVWRSQRQRLASIRSATPATVAELQELAAAVAQEIGPGSWREYVKVYGTIKSDAPLRSQLTETACVHYRTRIVREYEVKVSRRDEQGKSVHKIERRSETVASHAQSAPFLLADATGEIAVDLTGADLETTTVLSEFKPASDGAVPSYGGFSFDGGGNTQGTIGYRYEEAIVPIGRQALIFGMATDGASTLTLRKPTDSSQKYLLSLKVEEQLAQGAVRSVRFSLYAMLFCLGAGLLLLLAGLA